MTDHSRRGVLAGSLGVAATLAGCADVVDVTGESERRGEQYSRLAEEAGPIQPFPFPFTIPESMLRSHADRIESLLEAVPTEPEIPNEAVRKEVAGRREAVAERLDKIDPVATPDATPMDNDGSANGGETEAAADGTGSGDRTLSPERRLGELREIRRSAAELRGTYRAATGRYEDGDVVARRDRLRTRLAEFRAGWEYRGADPMAATLAHDEFEGDVRRIEHELTPWPQMPARPADAPTRVGYLAGKLEAAAALLDDVTTFQRRELPSTGPGYRPALMATAEWLGRRARRAGIDLDDAPRRGRSILDRDLGDGPTGALFDAAVAAYDRNAEREAPEGPRADNYASAVIAAASQRAAVTAAARTVEAIRDGLTIEEPSATLVRRRRSDARDALQAALDSGPTGFTAPTLGAAYRAFRDANDSLQAGDGAAALGRFEFARRVSTLGPDVVEEARFLLSEATG